LNFAGVYEVRDGLLVLVEPKEPELAGFEWRIRSPYMLILNRQATNTGADYLGAILFRSHSRTGTTGSNPDTDPPNTEQE
jgi:hypothetical protein